MFHVKSKTLHHNTLSSGDDWVEICETATEHEYKIYLVFVKSCLMGSKLTLNKAFEYFVKCRDFYSNLLEEGYDITNHGI